MGRNRFALVGLVALVLSLTACGDSGASVEAWCDTLNTPLPELVEPVSGDDFETRSLALFERNEELLEVAPDEIRDAVQTMVDFDNEWKSYVSENDVEDWLTVPRVFWSEDSGLEEQDMRNAGQEISQFAEENGCLPGEG